MRANSTTKKAAAPRARAGTGGTKARTATAPRARTAAASKGLAAAGGKRTTPAVKGANAFLQGTKNLLRGYPSTDQPAILKAAMAEMKGWSTPFRALPAKQEATTATRKTPVAARGATKMKAAGSTTRTPTRGRNRGNQQEAPIPQQAGSTTEQVAH
jgi:hypothetical protein